MPEVRGQSAGFIIVLILLSQITSAYITSRLEAMESVVRDNLDNPLDDNTIVSQQLDQMATIGR